MTVKQKLTESLLKIKEFMCSDSTKSKLTLLVFSVILAIALFCILRYKAVCRQVTELELERMRLEKELELIGAERAANAAELKAAEKKLAALQHSNDKRVREAAKYVVEKYDDMCGEDVADAFFDYLAGARKRNSERREYRSYSK